MTDEPPRDEAAEASPTGGASADPRDLAGWYRLAADLFAREPDAELLGVLAEVPGLRAHATPEAAARFTDVLVLNVHPFASVYLDADGALHAGRAAFTRDVLRALGLRVHEREGVSADHVSVALDALAALLEREADAVDAADAGDAVDAARARHAQRTVLAEHLLPWAPLFLGAVERIDDGLYRAAARMVRTTLGRHAARLAELNIAPPPTAAKTDPAEEAAGDRAPADDAAPPPAAEPSTKDEGAEDVEDPLAWLAAPARCGMFLARDDVAALAARAGLPARIGGRRFVLRELGTAAASGDEESEALRTALAAFARARRAELAAWTEELPAFAAVWRPLRARLAATEARLEGNEPSEGTSDAG
jgi:TorA maturation chaperone TorD